MLGPYLNKTEFIFKLPMGKRYLFSYKFRENIYQYVVGCYKISSPNHFFCRVNRSASTGKHIRMFVVTTCKTKYTSIEITPHLPCAFITTPAWVLVMTDKLESNYTGHLDPHNGGSLWVESQGIVESYASSINEMLSWISPFTYVTPSDLIDDIPDVIDDKYTPRDKVLILPEVHPLLNQTVVESPNIIKMLLTISPEIPLGGSTNTNSGSDDNITATSDMYVSLRDRVKNLKLNIGIPHFSSSAKVPLMKYNDNFRNYHHQPSTASDENERKHDVDYKLDESDTGPNITQMIHAWHRAGEVLSLLEPSKYTFHNICLLTHKLWSESHSIPPISTLDIKGLLLSFVEIAKRSTDNGSEPYDESKDTMYASMRSNARNVNDIILANIYTCSKLANTTMFDILLEFASEVMDIDDVTQSDILSFVTNPPPNIVDHLVKLSKTPVPPSAQILGTK